MAIYIVYDTATGVIRRTGSCPDDMVSVQPQSGQSVMQGQADNSTQYISGGLVTNKPALGATIDLTTVVANGVAVVTISNLTGVTNYRVIGPIISDNIGPTASTGSVSEGTLQVDFDLPGTYLILLEAVNKLSQTFTITATAP